MSSLTPVVISSYIRVVGAGFDIVVRNNGTKFRLHLMRGQEIVATSFAIRSRSTTAPEALRRIKLNLWGPAADIYQVVARLADCAEQQAPMPLLMNSRGDR